MKAKTTNTGMGLGVGVALGVALGAAFHHLAIGIAIGVAMGVVVPSALDANSGDAGPDQTGNRRGK